MARLTRRQALAAAGAATVASTLAPRALAQAGGGVVKKGRLKQSVCRWCYQSIPLDQFCQGVAKIGLTAIDLLQPKEWEVASGYGLLCSTGYPGEGGGTIVDGLNNRQLHDQIVSTFKTALPQARKMRVPNLITFFGNRQGRSDQEAIDNCIAALGRIKPMAEDHEVTVVVELLNSKVDHQDYQGDHTNFGVQVMKGVNSPRVKLLYDIYHMQIMEGDVIRTIRSHIAHIGHFHTGGVPGRNEIDDGQELNYRTVCTAIADAGFTGYLAHEFIPKRDPLASLAEAFRICDV